jgi:hypothetical protein
MRELGSNDMDRIFGTTKHYGGTYSKNNLPKLQNKFYVINMSNANQEGTHWTMLYNCRPKVCIYFDSFGEPMPTEVLNKMKQTKKDIVWSDMEIQNYNSQNCGYYCVDMIQCLEHGMTYKQAIDQFKHNTLANEKKIVTFSKINHIYASEGKGGGGIYSTSKKVIQAVTKATLPSAISRRIHVTLEGPRKGSTQRFSKFMDNTQDRKIDKVVVARKPIISGVKTILDGLSLGKFTKRQKELGYDNTYHNYSLIHFQGDPPGVWTKMEKNHVVEESRASPKDFQYEHYEIPLKGKDLTVKSMLNNAVKAKGQQRIYMYDASGTNCQEFIKDIIHENGLDPDNQNAQELIKPQNADHLLSGLGLLKPIHKLTTDLAGVADRSFYGDGFKNMMNIWK